MITSGCHVHPKRFMSYSEGENIPPVNEMFFQYSKLVPLDIGKLQEGEFSDLQSMNGDGGGILYIFTPKSGFKFLPVTYNGKPMGLVNGSFINRVELLITNDLKLSRIDGFTRSDDNTSRYNDLKFENISPIDSEIYFNALFQNINNDALVIEDQYPHDNGNIVEDYYVQFYEKSNKIISSVIYKRNLIWDIYERTGSTFLDMKVYYPKTDYDLLYFIIRLKNRKGAVEFDYITLTDDLEETDFPTKDPIITLGELGKSVSDVTPVYKTGSKNNITIELNLVETKVHDWIKKAEALPDDIEQRYVIEAKLGYVFVKIKDGNFIINDRSYTSFVFIHINKNWQLLYSRSFPFEHNEDYRQYYKMVNASWSCISYSNFKLIRLSLLTRVKLQVTEFNLGIDVSSPEDWEDETYKFQEHDGYIVQEIYKGGKSIWSFDKNSERVFHEITINTHLNTTEYIIHYYIGNEYFSSPELSLSIQEIVSIENVIHNNVVDKVNSIIKPVNSTGEVNPIIKPVDSTGEVNPIIKPVDSTGEVNPIIKPVDSTGEVNPIIKPVDSTGEVNPIIKPVDSTIEGNPIIKPVDSTIECGEVKPVDSTIEGGEVKPVDSTEEGGEVKPVDSTIEVNPIIKPVDSTIECGEVKPVDSTIECGEVKPVDSTIEGGEVKPVDSTEEGGEVKPVDSTIEVNPIIKPVDSTIECGEVKPVDSTIEGGEVKPVDSTEEGGEVKPVDSTIEVNPIIKPVDSTIEVNPIIKPVDSTIEVNPIIKPVDSTEEGERFQVSKLISINVRAEKGTDTFNVDYIEGYNDCLMFIMTPKDGFKFESLTNNDKPLYGEEDSYSYRVEYLYTKDEEYIRIDIKTTWGNCDSIYYKLWTYTQMKTTPFKYFWNMSKGLKNDPITVEPNYPFGNSTVTEDFHVQFYKIEHNHIASGVFYNKTEVWKFVPKTGDILLDMKVYHPRAVTDNVYFTFRLKDQLGNVNYSWYYLKIKNMMLRKLILDPKDIIVADNKTISDYTGPYKMKPKELKDIELDLMHSDFDDLVHGMNASIEDVESRFVIEAPLGFKTKSVKYGTFVFTEKLSFDYVYVNRCNHWTIVHYSGLKSSRYTIGSGRHYFKRVNTTWSNISFADFKLSRIPFVTLITFNLLKFNLGIKVQEIHQKGFVEYKLFENLGYFVKEIYQGDIFVWSFDTTKKQLFGYLTFESIQHHKVWSLYNYIGDVLTEYITIYISEEEYGMFTSTLLPPNVGKSASRKYYSNTRIAPHYVMSRLVPLDISNIDDKHANVHKVNGYKNTRLYIFTPKDGFKFMPLSYNQKIFWGEDIGFCYCLEFLVTNDIRFVRIYTKSGTNIKGNVFYDVTFKFFHMIDSTVYFDALIRNMNNDQLNIEPLYRNDLSGTVEKYHVQMYKVDYGHIVSVITYDHEEIWRFNIKDGNVVMDCKVYHPTYTNGMLYITIRLKGTAGDLHFLYYSVEFGISTSVSHLENDPETVLKSKDVLLFDDTVPYSVDPKTVEFVEFDIDRTNVYHWIHEANATSENVEERYVYETTVGFDTSVLKMNGHVWLKTKEQGFSSFFFTITSFFYAFHFTLKNGNHKDKYFSYEHKKWGPINVVDYKISMLPHLKKVSCSLNRYNEGLEIYNDDETPSIIIKPKFGYFVDKVVRNEASIWSFNKLDEVFKSIAFAEKKSPLNWELRILKIGSGDEKIENIPVLPQEIHLFHVSIYNREIEECNLFEDDGVVPAFRFRKSKLISFDISNLHGNYYTSVEIIRGIKGAMLYLFTPNEGFKFQSVTYNGDVVWGDEHAFSNEIQFLLSDDIRMITIKVDRNLFSTNLLSVDVTKNYTIMTHVAYVENMVKFSRSVIIQLNPCERHNDSGYYVETHKVKRNQMVLVVLYKKVEIWKYNEKIGDLLLDLKVYYPKNDKDVVFFSFRYLDSMGVDNIIHYELIPGMEPSISESNPRSVIQKYGMTISDTGFYLEKSNDLEPITFDAVRDGGFDLIHEGNGLSENIEARYLLEAPMGYKIVTISEAEWIVKHGISVRSMFIFTNSRDTFMHYNVCIPEGCKVYIHHMPRRNFGLISLTDFKLKRRRFMKVVKWDIHARNDGAIVYKDPDGKMVSRVAYGYFVDALYDRENKVLVLYDLNDNVLMYMGFHYDESGKNLGIYYTNSSLDLLPTTSSELEMFVPIQFSDSSFKMYWDFNEVLHNEETFGYGDDGTKCILICLVNTEMSLEERRETVKIEQNKGVQNGLKRNLSSTSRDHLVEVVASEVAKASQGDISSLTQNTLDKIAPSTCAETRKIVHDITAGLRSHLGSSGFVISTITLLLTLFVILGVW
ncbi:hypothetical protein BdWA1_002135 [Babesia duncani]|uniref:Uncharacterized protein n=1 Tax=Babesia duncani TaxID=323732 RepID=A0AAD9UPE1_9APIC|nr:hypothetical protein BdWA1_002135 [Babesia duncani]